MELRQLEYFVAVVEEASFTKAAARVHVAQPGVSAQIRRLERELGEELLDRSGRTVRLTAAGAAVLPYARAALGAVAGARLAVDELTGLTRGHVAMGMVISCSSVDVPALLAEFHEDHPGVEITLSEADSDHLIEALHSGELDLALVGLGVDRPPGIEIQAFVDERFVVVVGPGDALAGRETVPLDALRERSLISLPRGTGLRSIVDDACASAGFRPRVAFEASDPRMLAQLAGRGLGVAIVPESLPASYDGELRTLTLVRPSLRGRVALAWRAEGPAGPAARALIAHARKVLADLRADGEP
ncbi:LysR family transcriptional regulator [Sphaerisporangium sp. NBC_01403]|uniref:LysR family transcriptional regulator n=1 Tax=Sphaerisporangium sp. NBC_01403 TaxID=2903599 RepID=UPI003255801A